MHTPVWDLKSQYDKYQVQSVFDCFVAEYLLASGRQVGTQEETLKKYKVTTLEELAQIQEQKLSENSKFQALYTDIELPLTAILVKMEQKGIVLDTQKLTTVGKAIEDAIAKSEEILTQEFGSETNLNSSVQLGNHLAEKMGVPLSKTKTGRYATNEGELSKFQESTPIIKTLLEYRELAKLKSTYVESLITKVGVDGRVHTTYNQVAAATGRLSSVNPNLQNIPVTSHFGQQIKSCFVASPGHTLLSFDYSQQELRILAHLSEEDKLIEAFAKAQDIHTTTAAQIFHQEYIKVTKTERNVAKTINFGIIYGMGSYGLSASLGIPVESAQNFINSFYSTYPKIKTYYDHYLRQAQIDGFVETLLGRRRYVFEYPKQKFIDNATKRVLMNFPIQGSAADLTKKAMVDLNTQVLAKHPEVSLLLQIHDDVVFEVPQDEALIARLVPEISQVMCSIYPLKVPIEVEAKVGRSWGEMEKINHNEL